MHSKPLPAVLFSINLRAHDRKLDASPRTATQLYMRQVRNKLLPSTALTSNIQSTPIVKNDFRRYRSAAIKFAGFQDTEKTSAGQMTQKEYKQLKSAERLAVSWRVATECDLDF